MSSSKLFKTRNKTLSKVNNFFQFNRQGHTIPPNGELERFQEPVITSPLPEKKPEPEPLEIEPDVMILSQPMEALHSQIKEEDLNKEQKKIFEHMQKHPFQPSAQAPTVDPDMLVNLGPAISKSAKGDEKWEVEYENGTKFTGEIVTDEKSVNFEQPLNNGNFEFPNGDKYEGTVGTRALGTYTYLNGVVYEGQFFKLMKSGQGTQTFPDGVIYKGKFKKNFYDGKGLMTFPNGDSYQGNFKNGMRNNIGTYKFIKGDVVTGDWSDDLLHGNGQYNLNNGQKFKSAFQSSSIKLS